MNSTVGYSGTPLKKKLGIKNGFKITAFNSPKLYDELFLEPLNEIEWVDNVDIKKDFIHYFAYSKDMLEKNISALRNQIVSNGIIWISWPKNTSGYTTDLTGSIVRTIGLKNGLVDIKVCAVDNTWSGIKFVIPVNKRPKN